jgi:hypothetical protein
LPFDFYSWFLSLLSVGPRLCVTRLQQWSWWLILTAFNASSPLPLAVLVAACALALLGLWLAIVRLVSRSCFAGVAARFSPLADWLDHGRLTSSPARAYAWREEMLHLPVPPLKVYDSNPHGLAAAVRSQARAYALQLVRAVGLPEFMVEMSRRDQRDQLAGDRHIRDVKDAATYADSEPLTQPSARPTHAHAAVFCDVIDHLTPAEVLPYFSDPACTIVIAGQQFKDVAGLDGGVPFRYDPEARVWDYEVQGSGYHNPIYDWSGETRSMAVRRTTFTWRGFAIAALVAILFDLAGHSLPAVAVGLSVWLLSTVRYETHIRKIEVVDVSTHRSVVVLVPMRTYGTLRTLLTMWAVDDHLRRLEPRVVGAGLERYLGLRVRAGSESYTSIALLGARTSCRMVDAFETIVRSYASAHGTTMPGGGTLCTLAESQNIKISNTDALLCAAFVLAVRGTGLPHVSVQARVVEALRVYHVGVPVDPSPRGPGVRAVVPPFISGAAYAAARTRANEEATVEHRISRMRNDAMLDPILEGHIHDFVQCLAHDALVGGARIRMVDDETVYENQTRRTQRVKLDAARHTYATPGPRTAKAFQKAEPLAAAGAPRNITTPSDETRFAGARVEYALTAALKRVHWYAFGTGPTALAQRLADIHAEATTSTGVDYTNMDGTVGPIERRLDLAVRLRLFALEEHEAIRRVASQMYDNRVRCANGVSYDQGYGQGSGFADTSSANTIRNAFVAYYALRLAGFTVREAWSKLGLYGGDDGLTPNLPSVYAVEAANRIGKRVKVEVVSRGGRVCFLGRVYGPGVWFGEPNSCCDVRRTLRKLHCTTRPDTVGAATVLADKAASLLVSDAETPLIGDICRKWHGLARSGAHEVSYFAQQILAERERYALTGPPPPFVNRFEDWMWDVVWEAVNPDAVETIMDWVRYGDPYDPPTVQHDAVTIKPGIGPVTIDDVTFTAAKKVAVADQPAALRARAEESHDQASARRVIAALPRDVPLAPSTTALLTESAAALDEAARLDNRSADCAASLRSGPRPLQAPGPKRHAYSAAEHQAWLQTPPGLAHIAKLRSLGKWVDRPPRV